MRSEKAGVALLNMGSPSSTGDVRRFMRELFLDIEMFSFPGEGLVRPLFAALISTLRAGRVRRRYRILGGTSPLLQLTRNQAVGLEAALRARGYDVPVEVCMRYSRPFSSEAVERLRARGAGAIVGLPLYPQFSHSTSESSLIALTEAIRDHCPGMPMKAIRYWCDDRGYHRALAGRILACRRALAPEQEPGLLFLAHSVPERFVLRGDPYVEQVERTVAGVLDALRTESSEVLPWMLAYQSQVGPIKWVGPTVPQAMEAMLADGVRSLIAAPVSFVSDHLETLYDIDLEYRRNALELGFEGFERIESLNAGDDFLSVLAGLVINALNDTTSGTDGGGSSSRGEAEA